MRHLWIAAAILAITALFLQPGSGSLSGVAGLEGDVVAPTFSPPGGCYQTPQTIAIDCSTPDADIYYTLDGALPTTDSTLYSAPLEIDVTTEVKAFAVKSGWQDSTVASAVYRIDASGPLVQNLSAVPTQIREAVDSVLIIVAAVNDSPTGGCNVEAAEYFIIDDPGPGNGTAMSPVDAAFDSPVEVVTATLDVSTWTIGSYSINARGLDAAGNWGPVAAKIVNVVDGTPPGAVSDLTASPAGSVEWLLSTVDSFSSQAPGAPVTALLDFNGSTYWQTLGTASSETEFVVLDALGTRKLQSVALVPYRMGKLFPSDFEIAVSTDKTAWTTVARARAYKPSRPVCIWQFEPVDARYVKVSGPGVYNPSDGRYAWQIANIIVGRGGGALVQLAWTAPGDDGYLGNPVSRYDIRYSASAINAGNFASCAQATGLGTPRPPGTRDSATVGIDATTGRTYLALKTGDEIPNWSALSNVVAVDPHVTGFVSTAPDDASYVAPDAPPIFQFGLDSGARPAVINFSNYPEFVAKPALRPDGAFDRSVKFPLRAASASWQPTSSQWKLIKTLVLPDGVLYWRIEGTVNAVMSIYGETRSLVFDTGSITDLAVSPSHDSGGDEAVWPDVTAPATFSWNDETIGMKYFWVDVSSSDAMLLKDRKQTLMFGGPGITGASYAASRTDWKKIRALAASAGGTLYWRVRAKDAQKALTGASAVKTLLVDAGEWSLGDLDLSAAPPEVAWTHTGEGIVAYSLQFSSDAAFPRSARMTVRIPPRSVTALSYALKPADVARLKRVAAVNGVTTLYYRVRGEDAEKAFVAYSPSGTAAVP